MMAAAEISYVAALWRENTAKSERRRLATVPYGLDLPAVYAMPYHYRQLGNHGVAWRSNSKVPYGVLLNYGYGDSVNVYSMATYKRKNVA